MSESRLRQSFVERRECRREVSTPDRPFVVLFSQYSADETPHGRPVGKDTHHIGPAPYLLVQALLGVVGPHLLPVSHREGGEGQGVRSSLGQYRGGLGEPVSEL